MRKSIRTSRSRPLASFARWLPVSLPAVLLGCTAVPITSSPAQAQDSAATAVPSIGESGTSSDSQLMFEILVAELAGRRGQLDVALDGYLRAYPRSTDPRVAERATRLAIYARDWVAAEAAIDHWLKLDPDAREAHELRAQVLLRDGRLPDAAVSFLDYIELSPDVDVAWDEVGSIMEGDPDQVAARAVADEMVVLAPDNANAHLVVARLALAADDLDATSAALDRSLELAPDNAAARLLRAQLEAHDGHMDEALETLSEAREEMPDDVGLQLGEAEMMIEAGKFDQALVAMDQIGETLVSQGKDADPDSLLMVGTLATQIGALDEAERWFIALLSTGVHEEAARFQLARISDSLGDRPLAADRYEAVPPGDMYIPSQVRAAELRASIGEMDIARESLQMLRAMVPDPTIKPQIVSAEGRILEQAGQLDAAIEVLSGGLEDFPGNSALLYARALVADSAGRGEILEEDLGDLIESEPDNAHALNALGYYLVGEESRLDEAEIYIEKAIELRPDDPAIMDSLGWLRYLQGRDAEAITHLQLAWELLPDPEIASHLIEVLWKAGLEDDARAVHAEAMDLLPGDERLVGLLDKLAQ